MTMTKDVKQLQEEMINFRRDLHENPEVSFKEFRTTEKIKELMLSHGITVEPLDMPTGLSVLIKGSKPGPTICIRHDIDALPMKETTGLPFASKTDDACHSCGHDIHATTAAYTAVIVNKYKENLAGNLRVIFQPAEETVNGAYAMIKAGVLDLEPKNDVVVGLHVSSVTPVGKIALCSGPIGAGTDSIEITINGKGGHGAHPYSCSDVILTAGHLLTQLQSVVSRENRAVKPTILSFGSIHGGSAANILPSEIKLQGTLRSFYHDSREISIDAIKRITEFVCKSSKTEGTVEILEGKSVPPTINDADVIKDLCTAAKDVIGDENIVYMEFPSPGSDDFAVFLDGYKGAQIYLGTADENENSQLGLHNSSLIFNEDSIPIGVSLLVKYVMNMLNK